MSQAREKAARIRAVKALEGIADPDSRHIYLREYTTSGSGSSSSLKGTLHKQFVRHHGLQPKDSLMEFYDTETGALIILPKDGGKTDTAPGGD